MSGVDCHILSNGLRVVHHHDPSTAMVAVGVLYLTGARNESPELTGMAHLFEHLMFGGSANVPDFEREMQRASAVNNAWTSSDFTFFHEVLPARNINTALWVESDRMLAPVLGGSNLETQRKVVVEEFYQTCLNRPYGDLMHHVGRLAYTVHPYRWPVIGLEPDHIRHVTEDDAMRWHSTFYTPDRAVLSISGNIGRDDAYRLAEKWFADIPRSTSPIPSIPSEPRQTSERRATVEVANIPSTHIAMVWHMDGAQSTQAAAADLFTDILSLGRSSRFYREVLLKSDLFSDIDASISGTQDPGLLMVNARLNPQTDPERAVDFMRQLMAGIAREGVTEHETRRAINHHTSTQTLTSMGYLAKLKQKAMEAVNNRTAAEQLARVQALSAADISRSAAEILRPEGCSTLIYTPSGR